jgi:hypothetical protein
MQKLLLEINLMLYIMNYTTKLKDLVASLALLIVAANCTESKKGHTTSAQVLHNSSPSPYLSQPLVSHIYTADPSAHVFEGRF